MNHWISRVAMFALIVAPAISRGAPLTCLTGTDPSVAGDLAQITAARGLIGANCPCSTYDGSKARTHTDYVRCARALINTPGNLRPQCKGTVLKYYSNSTCGRNPKVSAEPCIQTNGRNGKITCTIRPYTKQDGVTLTHACTTGRGIVRTPAPAWSLCIDAADTNHDGLIDARDTGMPPPPPPNYWIFALQGLLGNTLVAGKTTALRLFTDATSYSMADHIEADITRPDGSRLTSSWSQSEFVSIPSSSLGSSVVVRVPGSDLPWIGGYHFSVNVFDAGGGLRANYVLDQAQLLPTKDVLVGIDRVNSDVDPGPPAEIQAAVDSLERLAAIWPVRDGMSSLDGDRTAGVRYVVNNNPQGYGCDGNPAHSDCQTCPFFANWLNRSVGLDSINLGIAYRFEIGAEGAGGNAPHYCPGQNLPYAVIVENPPLAPGHGQETGHCFGLEPQNDPHFDPTVQAGHSKDWTINPPEDSELGFDSQTNQPFPNPSFDVMHQVICACSTNTQVAYNAWDWEYLRQRFVGFTSTGPTKPALFMTDAAPAVSGVGNSVFFIAKRNDGRVYYASAVLGQGTQGWSEIDGDGLTDALPAAGAVGTHLFVAVKGMDGHIYINQEDLGGAFNNFWNQDSFETNVAPAVTGVGNSVFVFAKGLDGRIYLNQAQLGGSFSGWFEVPGNARTDAAPAAGAVGTHVFVAIKGLDGHIYINQADLGGSFNNFWNQDSFVTDVPPAVTGVGNSVFLFAKGLDGRIFLNEAQLGRSFRGWFELPGHGLTDAAPAAGAVGTHVFVAVKGLDGHIYINQADLGGSFNNFWLQD